jgi:hypothetical protein
MNIRLKKLAEDSRIIKLEGDAEIQEIMVHEDILFPNNERIHICYRGPHTSGIIEFKSEEIDAIAKRLEEKKKAFGEIKIFENGKRKKRSS